MTSPRSNLRVAMVAYHFPPAGGGLSHRSLKYVKYLPENGVETEVFCGEFADDAACFDERMLDEISADVPIHRTGSYHSWPIARRFDGTLFERTLRAAVRSVSHPDIFAGWARGVFRQLQRRHAEQPFDAVFTTSFPWSAHDVGLRARTTLGLPWVSDFRDPWTLNYEHRAIHPIVRGVHRRMEQRVYDSSDHVVLNTPGNLRDVLRAFPVDEDKFSVIPNGFDLDDLHAAPTSSPRKDGKFHLLYLGGLRGDWFEGAMYRSLAALKELDPRAYGHLVVDFVGADRAEGALCRQLGLGDVCRFHGFQKLDAVAGWLAASDACGLLLPPAAGGPLGWVPQKTYTYLASGKPILFWGPPGSTRDLLEETRAGIHVDPEAVYHAAAVLADWIHDHTAGHTPRGATREAAAPYDKRRLTRQLAEVFRKVCGREQVMPEIRRRKAA